MGEGWFIPYNLKEQTLDFSILLLLFLTVNLLSSKPWQYKNQSEKTQSRKLCKGKYLLAHSSSNKDVYMHWYYKNMSQFKTKKNGSWSATN